MGHSGPHARCRTKTEERSSHAGGRTADELGMRETRRAPQILGRDRDLCPGVDGTAHAQDLHLRNVERVVDTDLELVRPPRQDRDPPRTISGGRDRDERDESHLAGLRRCAGVVEVRTALFLTGLVEVDLGERPERGRHADTQVHGLGLRTDGDHRQEGGENESDEHAHVKNLLVGKIAKTNSTLFIKKSQVS